MLKKKYFKSQMVITEGDIYKSSNTKNFSLLLLKEVKFI